MNKNLKETIENNFGFSLNRNQYQELRRLIFEIKKRQNTSTAEIIEYLKKYSAADSLSGRNKFFGLKNSLVKCRFPLTASHKAIDTKKIFLNKVKQPFSNNWKVNKKFQPIALYFEKKVKSSYLIDNFKAQFPNLETKEISSLKEYTKNNKLKTSELKKPLIFIVEEKKDYLKPCPCTKGHLRCGYWIFNLGFGCPFDCSYCYLQQYTNTPGIILPANLEDFFNQFDTFRKKLRQPIRIGTGEFCDSLALDDITKYSTKLIPFFANKGVLFELKTKSNKIENILGQKPSSNIIISWSLNPQKIIALEEEGSVNLEKRLEAAKKIKEYGFKVAFHFDPIIHYKGWEKDYKKLVEKLYANLDSPFAWISLGTLRCNRGLKSISEQRFPESNIFYGELFLGKDNKLRYPPFLRKIIYQKMFGWIKRFDSKTPIYLCMENKDIWKTIGGITTSKKIEKLLIDSNL